MLPLGIEIEDAAWEMMKSREYQNAKCDYGSPDDTDFFSVAIPQLRKNYRLEPSGIIDGDLRIGRYSAPTNYIATSLNTDSNRNELQNLFDIQVRIQKKGWNSG